MKVSHTTFGEGLVISADDNNVTVDFNGMVKTLVIAFCRLKKEDGSDYGVSFVAKDKKSKKLNKSNFMSKEEYSKSKAGMMSESEWAKHRELKVKDSMQSSLR